MIDGLPSFPASFRVRPAPPPTDEVAGLLRELADLGFAGNDLTELLNSTPRLASFRRAVPLLVAALEQAKDPPTIAGVARLLRGPHGRDAAEALLVAYSRVPEVSVRWAIGDALEAMASPKLASHVNTFQALIEGPGDKLGKQGLVAALGRIGTDEAQLAARTFLQDPELGRYALQGIERGGGTLPLSELTPFSDDDEAAWVRRSVAVLRERAQATPITPTATTPIAKIGSFTLRLRDMFAAPAPDHDPHWEIDEDDEAEQSGLTVELIAKKLGFASTGLTSVADLVSFGKALMFVADLPAVEIDLHLHLFKLEADGSFRMTVTPDTSSGKRAQRWFVSIEDLSATANTAGAAVAIEQCTSRALANFGRQLVAATGEAATRA